LFNIHIGIERGHGKCPIWIWESPLPLTLLLDTNLWPKFEILTILGAVFPHFCPDKREIWHGERTKFHVYRGNRERVENPIFGPLSKNNTCTAALRTGLPVINLLILRREFLQTCSVVGYKQ